MNTAQASGHHRAPPPPVASLRSQRPRAPEGEPVSWQAQPAGRGHLAAAPGQPAVRVWLDGTPAAAQLQAAGAYDDAEPRQRRIVMPHQLSLTAAQVYPRATDRFFYAVESAHQDAMLGALIGGAVGWLMVGREAVLRCSLYGALCYSVLTFLRTMAGHRGILLHRAATDAES